LDIWLQVVLKISIWGKHIIVDLVLYDHPFPRRQEYLAEKRAS
jgi:hypothetical protein